MKTNLLKLIVILSLQALLVNSQEMPNLVTVESEIPRERKIWSELGLNASSLLDRFLNTQNDSTFKLNVYHLTYKLLIHKWAIRAGFGMQWRNLESKVGSFSDITTVDSRNMNIRFGLERRFTLSPRWQTYVGADAIYAYRGNEHITDSGFDRIITLDVTTEYGGGLAAGFQFSVLKNFLLGVEAGMSYTVFQSESQTRFDIFEDFNKPLNEKSGINVSYFGPEIIYLIYKF